jgi:hypothetical protein
MTAYEHLKFFLYTEIQHLNWETNLAPVNIFGNNFPNLIPTPAWRGFEGLRQFTAVPMRSGRQLTIRRNAFSDKQNIKKREACWSRRVQGLNTISALFRSPISSRFFSCSLYTF